MRVDSRDRDSAAGLVLLFALMASILAFYYVADRVRQRIESNRLSFLEFLGDWHSFKADLALHVSSGEEDDSSLISRLAHVDGMVARVSEAAVPNIMRALKPGSLAEPAVFRAAWLSVRAAAEALLALSAGGAGRAGYDALAAGSSSFETRAALWLQDVDAAADTVRKSIAILQSFLILAALAMAASGAWYAVSAAKSRRVEELLRDLMRATYRAQEEERKRISLELHDTVAQELSAAGMHASCLAADASGHRDALQDSLRRAIGDLRSISWGMRPPELERAGLPDAIAEYCRRFEESSGLAVRWTAAEDVPREQPDEVSINLYRIVQEALANARKHAGAAAVDVSLRAAAGTLMLRIKDDGVGFDPEALVAGPGHRGMAGMRERATLLGGSLSVVSGQGVGTEIRVEVPHGR